MVPSSEIAMPSPITEEPSPMAIQSPCVMKKSASEDPRLPGIEADLRVIPHSFFIGRSKPIPSVVYDTYWQFAACRQETIMNACS